MIKKILASVMLLSMALCASAGFRWGPELSLNVNNYHWPQPLLHTSQRPGFNVGLKSEVMIPGIGFGVDFGLRYSMHGANYDFGAHEVWASSGLGKENVWFHSIQIPVDIRFKWTRMNGLEDIVAPLVYAGPVFSFTAATSDCPAIEYPAGSVAIQVGLGAELWKHLQVTAGYYWGVTYEVRTVKLDNLAGRPQGWHLNVCYLF